jgi:hypothetical protein
MSASGKAMAMRIELSRYRREPPPFAPPALLNAPDHDVIVEGYAAPDLVDREFMRFASYCWYPLPKEIPLLVKHESNRPAGKILEARLDDGGLYV